MNKLDKLLLDHPNICVRTYYGLLKDSRSPMKTYEITPLYSTFVIYRQSVVLCDDYNEAEDIIAEKAEPHVKEYERIAILTTLLN